MREALETVAGKRGWIISDGRAGNDVQTRGVFDALGLSYETKRVAPTGLWRALSPWGPVSPSELFGTGASQFHPPWPEFAIAIGRLTIPYIRRLKRVAGLRTYTIILLDPRVSASTADLFWVPEHDLRRGPNVVTTLTAPHSFTARRLRELRAHLPPDIAELPTPRVAVLLGGPNGVFRYTSAALGRLATALRSLADLGAGLMITPSRRTPTEVAALRRRCHRGHAAHLLERARRQSLPFVRGARGCVHRPGQLRQHDGRAVRDGQARLSVRARRRLGQVYAFPRGVAASWRDAGVSRAHRAARAVELHADQLGGYDRCRDCRTLGPAAPDAGAVACGAGGGGLTRMAFPIVPFVVATALFMENTDSTILSTALPTIARDLGLDPISLKLAVTSYLVSLAVFIPVSGWVADRVGSCTTFRLALAVFMVASIGCAYSNSLGQFVFWRAVQGLGGAMMVPVGRMMVIRAVPKAELVQALSFIAMPALMGPMLGPPLGGLIVTYTDWRWIFFVNIPIGILGIVLATLFIPEIREETPPLDAKGFFLLASGLGGLILGTAMMGRRIAPPEVALGCIAAGAIALPLYARHAFSVPRPLLDLRLLRFKTFEAGIAGGVFFRFGVGASAFLLPLMLQLAFGLDALHSGLITFAGAAGALMVKPLARGFLHRFGFRRLLIVNGVLASAVLLASALFTPATPHLVIILVLLAGGFLRSLQFTSLSAITYAEVETRQVGSATGMASVGQQVSVSLGVAVGAMAVELSEWARGHTAPETADFSTAFVVVGLMSMMSALLMLRLPADAGDEISGRAVPEASRTAAKS